MRRFREKRLLARSSFYLGDSKERRTSTDYGQAGEDDNTSVCGGAEEPSSFGGWQTLIWKESTLSASESKQTEREKE